MPRLIGSSATLTPAFGADVLAVAVALETAAAQRDAEDVADVPERLRPFVVCRSTGEGILGKTLEGALACLIKDCGVLGLTAQPDEPEFFDGS